MGNQDGFPQGMKPLYFSPLIMLVTSVLKLEGHSHDFIFHRENKHTAAKNIFTLNTSC